MFSYTNVNFTGVVGCDPFMWPGETFSKNLPWRCLMKKKKKETTRNHLSAYDEFSTVENK